MNWNRRSFLLTAACALMTRFQNWYEFKPTDTTCRKIDMALRRNNAATGRTTCYFDDVPFDLRVRRNMVAVKGSSFEELKRRFGTVVAHSIIESLVHSAIDGR